MKTTTIFAMIGLFIFALFNEAPAQPQYQTLKQPDGTTFKAIERGEQWLQFFETPEGFVIRRGGDGYYQYFNIDALGEFAATGLKVGIDSPTNVPVRPYNLPAVQQALIRKIEAFNAAAEINRQRYLQRQRGDSSNSLGKGSSSTTQSSQQTEVTLNVGVLLVEFNDVPHYAGGTRPNGYTIADFETMLFSNDSYITQPPGDPNGSPLSPDNEVVFGSLRDYFEFQSHGLLHVTGQVINPNTNGIPTWLPMGNSSNYNSSYYGIKVLLKDAINAAILRGWNVNYDIIAMVLAQDPYAPNVGFYTGYAYFQTHYSPTDFDNDGDGSPDFDYANWFGGYALKEREDLEWRDPSRVTFTHIGLHCHEMFHVIGWGMYNILGEGGLIWHDVVAGDWSSMGVGYRTGALRKSESPGDLDPVARIVMEWAFPTHVNADLPNESVQYLEVDNNPNANFDFYQFNDPHAGSSEQFIVENRQYSGFNSFLPEWWKAGTKGGLLVWWRNGQTRNLRRGDNNTNVVLEGMPHVSDGDLGDPFPGSTDNRVITMSTAPNTNNSSGDPTGFAITNISSSATTMTATFRKSHLTSNSAEATASNNSRKLVRDSGGTYHLVFETGGEIYYQKSTDGGSSWIGFKRLSTGNGNNKYPSITGTNSKQFVVWQRYTGYSGGQHKYDTYFAKNTGSGWSTTTIANLSNLGFSTQINPLPVVTYKTRTGGYRLLVCLKTSSAIRYVYSDNDGSSWSSAANLPSTSSSHKNPSLSMGATTPTNPVYVTYDNGNTVYFNEYDAYGWEVW